LTAPPPLERRHAGLRSVGWLLVFVLLGIAFSSILSVAYAVIAHGGLEAARSALLKPGLEQALVGGIGQLTGFLLATWIVGVRQLRLSYADLRWRDAGPRGRGFGLGFLLGLGAAVLALLIAVALGHSAWARGAGDVPGYAATVVKTTAALAPAALSEEVLFRGLPLVILAALMGRVPAILLLSLLFALAHTLNFEFARATSHDIVALGLGNILLAGVWLSLAFYAPGGIWTAWGAHLGWNATLAALGTPVSGLPFPMPLVDYHAGAPVWVTGGSFGPEGGLAASGAMLAAAVAAARWERKGWA
jgi:membrane protease YdiL (CAAX protease family)